MHYSSVVLANMVWAACIGFFVRYTAADVVPDDGCQARFFDLTITWENHAPDGFTREMALINGQFPGPLLEVDQGDTVEVFVHNELPYNTTVHFHGIEMQGTPWSDGMPGLSQRQIRTGNSFLYKWKATQYGSYWYHAHQRGQLDDGLYGPIRIRPKVDEPRPFHLIANDSSTLAELLRAEQEVRTLVLSDLRHIPSEESWDIEVAAGIETPCYDSILFNGKGSVQCWSQEKIDLLTNAGQKMYLQLGNETHMTAKGCLPADVIANVLAAGLPSNLSALPPEVFDVCDPTTGSQEVVEVRLSESDDEKWFALDLIGTFGLVTGSFAIDGHPMWVYAVDGSYIEPTLADVLTITNGDRFSVFIKATQVGNYTIRMASTAAAQMLAAEAVLSVVGPTGAVAGNSSSSGEAYIDDVGVNTTASVVFFDDTTFKPYPADNISQTSDETFKLGIKVAGASYNWALNSTAYPQQLNNDEPLLFKKPQPLQDPTENNVTISTRYGDWVDLVFETLTFPMPPHPIHKHGTKMWLIGTGTGPFNYSSVVEAVKAVPESFNLVDPPKRDTLAVPAAATGPVWMVVRYHVTNPGAWFLHCHIQSHLLGGMGMAIQDGVDRWPEVPAEYVNYY